MPALALGASARPERTARWQRRSERAGRATQEQLDAILSELASDIQDRDEASKLRTLFDATRGWVAERGRDKDLKRTTLAGYDVMFERLYRDLGAETPLKTWSTDACAATSTTAPTQAAGSRPLPRSYAETRG